MPPLAKLIKSVGNMTKRVELENWSRGEGEGRQATRKFANVCQEKYRDTVRNGYIDEFGLVTDFH